MERHRRLLLVWSAAALIGAASWGVAEHWSGRWPALIGVLLFLVAALTALALSLPGAPSSRIRR